MLSEFAKDLVLVEAPFDEIKSSLPGRKGKNDGLSVKDTKNTVWWKMNLDGDEVGIVAMIKVKEGVQRLKAAYVLPEWRRQGFYTIAAVQVMKKAQEVGSRTVSAFVRPNSGIALKNVGWHHPDPEKTNVVEVDVEDLDLSGDLYEVAERISG